MKQVKNQLFQSTVFFFVNLIISLGCATKLVLQKLLAAPDYLKRVYI